MPTSTRRIPSAGGETAPGIVTPGSSLTERLSLASACAHRTWNELEDCLPTITNVLAV
ncbi:hypothetical protein [Brucella pituitosa]|uniref:hypothetical protein n=1 Tax=Brucella pituitosa TaxID=571256 RepID=UPI003F4A89E8